MQTVKYDCHDNTSDPRVKRTPAVTVIDSTVSNVTVISYKLEQETQYRLNIGLVLSQCLIEHDFFRYKSMISIS